MKSLIKTLSIILMAMGVHLVGAFWVGLSLALFGGICYFLADFYEDCCCMVEDDDDYYEED